MATLNYKIDFVFFLAVYGANLMETPLNGNMPRTDYDGYGEISDVCIKEKLEIVCKYGASNICTIR